MELEKEQKVELENLLERINQINRENEALEQNLTRLRSEDEKQTENRENPDPLEADSELLNSLKQRQEYLLKEVIHKQLI